MLQRPFREALATRRLAVASDDPEALAACLRAGAPASSARRAGSLGALGILDVAGLARDAAQPA
jgi:hypothetical protein